MHTISTAIALFKAEKRQIKKWLEDFNKYFSDDGGRPQKGTQSFFNDDDFQVLALIKILADKGATKEQIEESLALGNRAEIPEIPKTEISSRPPENSRSKTLNAYLKEVRELRNATTKIESLLKDVSELVVLTSQEVRGKHAELHNDYREEQRARIRAESRLEALQIGFNQQLDTIEELNREIGELRYQLRQAVRQKQD